MLLLHCIFDSIDRFRKGKSYRMANAIFQSVSIQHIENAWYDSNIANEQKMEVL